MKTLIFASWILSVFGVVQCFLELKTEPITYGVHGKEVNLKCSVLTDQVIKEVIWYRIHQERLTPVYYYEPPEINGASLNRARLSADDNSSLILSPVYLSDEGTYQCHVAVWQPETKSDDNFNAIPSMPNIPEEGNAKIKLIVAVSPNDVQLTTLSSGKNFTLSCRAKKSKPPASVTWLKVAKSGTVLYNPSKKVVTEYNGKLADSIGHQYYTLSADDKDVTFSCVVTNLATATVIYRNVTLIAPVFQNHVTTNFDRLGGSVTYSSYTSQNYDDSYLPVGLVRISVSPGIRVPINSSVVIAASADDVFPEPSYTWWMEDGDAHSEDKLTIDGLTTDVLYFVLAENPVGRAVLSVPLTVYDPNVQGNFGANNSFTATGYDETGEPVDTGELHGAVLAAIILGALLLGVFISLTIWYCTCKSPPNSTPKERKAKPPQEITIPSHGGSQPLMRSISTQTLERHPRSDAETLPSEAKLVASSKKTRHPTPEGKRRALTQHLNDYDESASFVDDYGSRFGLESNASQENLTVVPQHLTKDKYEYHSINSASDSDQAGDIEV